MAGQRVNIVLDEERAIKLRRLADRTHMNPGTLARSLLSTALDDADPDPRTIVDILDRIPGAWQDVQPFSFLSVSGKGRVKKPRYVREVRAFPERSELRIEFPRLVGYRYEMPSEQLDARFDASSILELSTREVALRTEVDPIVGLMEVHQVDLREHLMQTVVFAIAKRTMDNHFRDEDGGERPWLFPVLGYAKNQGLNFKIPYTYEGRPGNYVPDFLIRLRDAASTGPDDQLTLVLEVSGEAKKEKQAKVAAAEHLWTVAVNNWGGAGRWAFLEITDPWDAESLIRARFLQSVKAPA